MPALTILASRHGILVLENLALHQQMAVYWGARPKPEIGWSDRLFWIGLRWARSGLDIGPRGRPARDGRRLASPRIPTVLDVEEPTSGGSADRPLRGTQPDSHDIGRESPLGCAPDSR